MTRKKPAEEHENLERWLVSYADFMTLLFATFVVLYALAQSDVNSFKGIEDALKKAFTQNIFDNQTSVLSGADSILEGQNGAVNPLMLEYMSQKYEQASYDEIKEDINDLKKDGLSAEIDDRGLVIKLNSNVIKFAPASADLTKDSYETLDTVAKIIKEKFAIHYIQVEGHTDSDKFIHHNIKFPSNWELSSARASSVIRYLIDKHSFNPKIFSAVGLADTVPIAANTTTEGKMKNRRVEIVILRNKNKNLSKKNMQDILKEAKALQAKANKAPSAQIEGLVGNDREMLKNVIDMSNQYENETERLKTLDGTYSDDGQKPDFME